MSKNLLNLLLLVATFALYYLVVSPLYTGVGTVWQPKESILALKEKNNQYELALNQANNLFLQAEALHNQYSNFSEETKVKMNLMVPDNVDPVRLLSEVNSIANSTGVALLDLGYSEIQPVASSPSRGAYGVSFSLKTSYSQFKELMHNYETSLRLFTIKNVTFSVPENNKSLIEFQVKLETYYLK